MEKRELFKQSSIGIRKIRSPETTPGWIQSDGHQRKVHVSFSAGMGGYRI